MFTKETDDDKTLLDIEVDSDSRDNEFKTEEILKLLKELNTSKSPGPDQVHSKVLHELSDVVATPLCLIFNSSLKSGIVPDSWKIGQITALCKKGDKKLASNYRPVSLTSIICKIMEKLIRKKIFDHFNRHNVFSNRQFGFIGARSTALQLLVVLEHWTRILDEGGAIYAIYTDFMKAFDKVPHKRLINKLKSYRISDQTCLWIRNFLSNECKTMVNFHMAQGYQWYSARFSAGPNFVCCVYQRFTELC